jgi:cysteinyl-tRNA synthetase
MTLVFYNTLTRKKELFKPAKKGHVKMYACGPTVYDYAHIGNFRAYVIADLIRRYLEYTGLSVTLVMNITDVDDKTIRNSRKQNKALAEFTAFYKKAFFEDIEKLNVKPATHYPEATAHIEDMVALIKKLLAKGSAYKAKDGIYYSITAFKPYGQLARLNMKGRKAGARIRTDEYDKENVHDFVLWKFWDRNDGEAFWETELGKGRPGWHIECSAMSMKYLGERFDIHSGGVDLIFPHHQNEIAQSEAVTGKPFVRYWLHNEHLFVNGKKMAKSLGNFITLRDLLAKGHSPRAIRYLLLSAHYRTRLNLTTNALEQAAETVKHFDDFIADVRSADGEDSEQATKLVSQVKQKFTAALDDDLNMPAALSALFNFMKEINRLMDKDRVGKKNVQDILTALMHVDTVLGLSLSPEEPAIDSEIQALIHKREEYRKKNKWKEADMIRTALRKKGIIIEDTKDGVKIKRVKN